MAAGMPPCPVSCELTPEALTEALLGARFDARGWAWHPFPGGSYPTTPSPWGMEAVQPLLPWKPRVLKAQVPLQFFPHKAVQ